MTSLRREAEALANELDQLFRQRHTMADVECVVRKAFKAQRREEVEAIQADLLKRYQGWNYHQGLGEFIYDLDQRKKELEGKANGL